MKIISKINTVIVIGLIYIIKIYQFIFSFDHSFWAKYINIRVCIHEPSCSMYTIEALKKYGVFKGLYLGTLRILRCNPWGKGGYDPLK